MLERDTRSAPVAVRLRRRVRIVLPGAVVGMFAVLTVTTGIAAGKKWPDADGDFYGDVSGIIATLFVAIALELFSRGRPMWEDKLDQYLILSLLTTSWFGLFACVRAMFSHGTAWTAGLAAAGLMSASILVSLALFSRIKASAGLPATVVLAFLAPPVFCLVIL